MYTARQVSELLGLSIHQVRRFARQGYLTPERTPQNHYRFSFQDLTFLRTTSTLLDRGPQGRRVHRALRELRRHYPSSRSLAELNLAREDETIVAFDGGAAWEAESGQVIFPFAAPQTKPTCPPEPSPEIEKDVVDLPVVANARNARAWFDRAVALEERSPVTSRQAYRMAIKLKPDLIEARINLGRLLHDAGQVTEAIDHYRAALEVDGGSAIAATNLGVALEDVDRPAEAFTAYAAAIAADPSYADAHFNIAKLYEQAGDELAALRHLRTYRDLVRTEV